MKKMCLGMYLYGIPNMKHCFNLNWTEYDFLLHDLLLQLLAVHVNVHNITFLKLIYILIKAQCLIIYIYQINTNFYSHTTAQLCTWTCTLNIELTVFFMYIGTCICLFIILLYIILFISYTSYYVFLCNNICCITCPMISLFGNK